MKNSFTCYKKYKTKLKIEDKNSRQNTINFHLILNRSLHWLHIYVDEKNCNNSDNKREKRNFLHFIRKKHEEFEIIGVDLNVLLDGDYLVFTDYWKRKLLWAGNDFTWQIAFIKF